MGGELVGGRFEGGSGWGVMHREWEQGEGIRGGEEGGAEGTLYIWFGGMG